MRTLSLLALLVLAACSKAAPAPTVAKPEAAPVAAIEKAEPDAGTVSDLTAVTLDERRCTSNADCALITEDCCGCDSGGKQVGVRKDAIAELGARRTPICSQVACSQQLSDDNSCDARRARCMEGQCVADVPGARPPAGVAVEKIGD
jgi:hypothetical protein